MAEIEKIVCTCCGKEKKATNPGKRFYESQSVLYKYYQHIPVCKDCIDEIYNSYKNKYKDERLTIYEFCRLFDLPYSDVDYYGAVQNSEKTGWKLYQSYFKQINSFGDVNNVGTCFESGERLKGEGAASSILQSKSDEKFVIIEEDYTVDDDVREYWGKGLEDWEYEFLDNDMHRLTTDFECGDYGMEMILKDIAFTNLEIHRNRSSGSNMGKLIETRSKLMNDGNLKPVQATGADQNEKLSFGVLIKKWENEKPIRKEPDDEMKKYIDTFMVGHLSKMQGVSNEFTRRYDEHIKEYNIDFNELRRNVDDE